MAIVGSETEARKFASELLRRAGLTMENASTITLVIPAEGVVTLTVEYFPEHGVFDVDKDAIPAPDETHTVKHG